jgi:hypothetical protein
LQILNLGHGWLSFVQTVSVFLSICIFLGLSLRLVGSTVTFCGSNILHSLSERTVTSSPAGAPRGYAQISDLKEGMEHGLVPAYGEFQDLRMFSFGENIRFLTPAIAKITKGKIDRLEEFAVLFFGRLFKTALWLAVPVLLIKLMQGWSVTSNFGNGIANFVAVNAIFWAFFYYVVILSGVTFVLAAIDIAFIKKATPNNSPMAQSDEEMVRGKSPITPAEALKDIELGMKSKALSGFANRQIAASSELAGASIQNSGNFSASLIIERQPVPVSAESEAAAAFLMRCAIAAMVFSQLLFWFVVVPAPAVKSLTDYSIYIDVTVATPILTAAIASLSFALWRAGTQMLQESSSVLNAMWYSSPTAMVTLTGSIQKDRLNIGKAEYDSFGSESEFTRMEFTAEVTAAEVVSETQTPNSERQVIALLSTPESRDWLKHITYVITQIAEKKAKGLEADFKSKEVDAFVAANQAAIIGRVKAETSARAEVLREIQENRSEIDRNKFELIANDPLEDDGKDN